MTDTFVCGECEQECKNSVLTKTKFKFPAHGLSGVNVIIVDVNLCTSCFINGGLSKHQKERIRSRILQKMSEADE